MSKLKLTLLFIATALGIPTFVFLIYFAAEWLAFHHCEQSGIDSFNRQNDIELQSFPPRLRLTPRPARVGPALAVPKQRGAVRLYHRTLKKIYRPWERIRRPAAVYDRRSRPTGRFARHRMHSEMDWSGRHESRGSRGYEVLSD
jgi:hypothetical protein